MISKSERQTKQPLVFISYSHRDKTLVDRISRDLSTEGFIVWYDDWSIVGGQSIIEEIQLGLERADYLIFCMSKYSLLSIFVREEVHSALAAFLKKGRPKIVPLLINTCNIPPMLAHRKYVDFRKSYETGLVNLRKALAGKYIRPPASSPHRFVEYMLINTTTNDGGSIIEKKSSVVAVFNPLLSLQVPFHTTALPSMPDDNITLDCDDSSRYKGRLISRGKDFALVQFTFDPPLLPGDPPVVISYRFIIKKCHPTTFDEMIWQKEHGAVDWDILFDGALLPVPVDRMIYQLSLKNQLYTEPKLRITMGMEGQSSRLEIDRVERLGNIIVKNTPSSYIFRFDIDNIIPGVFYGAEWKLK